MTNEELMNLMTDMGLHEGGMENWVMDNAWVKVANRVAEEVRGKTIESEIRCRFANISAIQFGSKRPSATHTAAPTKLRTIE